MPNGVADKGCGQFSLYDVFLGGREDLQTHYYGLAAAKVYSAAFWTVPLLNNSAFRVQTIFFLGNLTGCIR